MPIFAAQLSFYFLLLCSLTITLTSDIKIATNNAAPNEEKLKCSAPQKEVILRIAALITNVNNPNVANVKGRDSIVKNRFDKHIQHRQYEAGKNGRPNTAYMDHRRKKRTANDMNVNVLTKIR